MTLNMETVVRVSDVIKLFRLFCKATEALIKNKGGYLLDKEE